MAEPVTKEFEAYEWVTVHGQSQSTPICYGDHYDDKWSIIVNYGDYYDDKVVKYGQLW